MSPAALGWRKPSLILMMVVGLMAYGLAFAPRAEAAPLPNYYEHVTYDCMTGQTVGVQPGPLTVFYQDPSNGAKSLATVEYAAVSYNNENLSFRDGTISADGHSASFSQYTGIPMSESGEIVLEFTVYTDGNMAEHSPSIVSCEGNPADDDHDGIPNDNDSCPNDYADPTTHPNGCPDDVAPPGLNVSTTPAHVGQADGSISAEVTNPVDSTGAEVTYSIQQDGNEVTTVGPVADGASQTATWSVATGTYVICAVGNDGTQNCANAEVGVDETPALAGTATFSDRCFGIRTKVTNTGWETTVFEVEYTDYTGWVVGQHQAELEPGESFSYDSTRHFGLRAVARIPNGEFEDIVLGTYRWQVPDGCVPMKGGAKVISWGKDLTKHRGTPVITVRTKASFTKLGFQWRRGSPVHYVKIVKPGDHKLRLSVVPRHSKRCFRIWAQWGDGTRSRISNWHCYRRP